MDEATSSAPPTRPWLASYPPGVPHEIDARAFPSLKPLFEASFVRYASHPAFRSFGSVLTYSEIDRLSAAFGAWLQHEAGLLRGDRVALVLPNILAFPAAFIGALRAGIAVVPMNPLSAQRELAFQLVDSGAKAVVVLDSLARQVRAALPAPDRCRIVVARVGDLLPFAKRMVVDAAATRWLEKATTRIDTAVALHSTLSRGARFALRDPGLEAGDLALLQYTGGTTGRPKAAMLTHGNLVANIEQTRAWVASKLQEGCETVVTALPLYHAFALTANLLVFMRLGGLNVLVADPRRRKALVRLLARVPFTAITGVDSLYRALLDAPGFDAVRRANAGRVKVAIAGGMALERTTAERWRSAMGTPLVEGYGLTEASPNVCVNRLDEDSVCAGRLGLPLPSTDVAIVDERGAALPVGEMGEIAVKGPQVMRGYWNAPEETAQVLTPQGWLRTGDIGRMDSQGFVHFIERRKDVIVVSGFKAFPAAIEAIVREHPGVADVAAIGVPDARSGQAVALCVVKKDPALTAEDLRSHCETRLAPYERPRFIEFVERLPVTALGKTLRRELRDELAARVSAKVV